MFDRLKRQKFLSFALLFVTLILGIAIGTIVNIGVKAQHPNSAIAPDATPLSIPSAEPVNNDFNRLTKKVEPSVVYIESDYLPKPGAKQNRKGKEDEDENNDSPESGPQQKDPSDLFKRFFGNSEPRSLRSEGTGAGFIVDKNGYLLTNFHVVENADRIRVKVTGDSSEYKGRVVGYDKETDLAVLKIEAQHALPFVQIGNSDAVQVGDWVIAIGSPFGLQATVTAGIISALRTSRDLPSSNSFQNYLQTDAAINPGNSGGPLLNIRGEVVGVNTMIATRGGSYEGVGFALPSNMAAKVYNDIIRDGRVVRGSIGVKFAKEEGQSSTIEAFGLDHGVLVSAVSEDGPAGKAGLKVDDVIESINDKPVKDGADLVNHVADLPIGSTAKVTIDRDGKRMDFNVAIGERSQVWKGASQVTEYEPKEATALPASTKTPAQGKFGITIQRLSDKERRDLMIDDKSGVRVVSVDPGSFADDIGMLDGDTILSINRIPVLTPDDVMRSQAGFKPGQPVALHVARIAGKHAEPQRLYLSGHLPNE